MMPQLAEVATIASLNDGPASILTSIAVGDDGSIAIPAQPGGSRRIIIFDSIGTVSGRIGDVGEGPGELRGATPLGITTERSQLLVFDMSQGKLVTYGLDGTLITEIRLQGMALPRLILDDASVLAAMPGPQGIRPATVDLSTGTVSELVPATDSFLHSLAGDAAGGMMDPARVPALGHWAGGVVVGDKSNYRLGLYDSEGDLVRTLTHSAPPPRMTPARAADEIASLRRAPVANQRSEADWEKLRSEILGRGLPHFTHTNPLYSDGEGRLWVLGTSGDSAYADVFSVDRHLGRLELGCSGFKGSWALQDNWLALICAPRDTESVLEAVVQVYRISG